MSNHDISVLNDLIKTTLDSRKGYLDACEDASARFADTFAGLARERSEIASRLQGEVRRQGGDPADDSGVIGAAHRGFMDLKNAVTGTDDTAVVKEVERGEDHIKAKFEKALKDGELTVDARRVIEECYTSVKAAHDRMSALKHSMT
ncbi:PA2169 family four-helix-bundle protein [Sphingosinithalassobacter sp. LHW66-3]|uniref:PA2169 family four-helix-bundle protein n=1 Tax=Sphingosinithalassobacter sp. LHW66-3 TaxID=3424718 RepID=UPI003D6B6E1D